MPIYVYRAVEPESGCETCAGPFEVVQSMKDDPLASCPECGVEVEKRPTVPGMSFPKGPSELRNLGFARLEKRSDGKYENVSAQDGQQRVGSLESFGKDLAKGKKKIISD
jgi:putative FmdB family regulatory protein